MRDKSEGLCAACGVVLRHYDIKARVDDKLYCVQCAGKAIDALKSQLDRAMPILAYFAAQCDCLCGDHVDYLDAAKALLEEVEG